MKVNIRKTLDAVDHRKDELDLVVIPGVMRSGTTVTFQAIHGVPKYIERYPAKLVGSPPSEHWSWRVANYAISKYLGAEPIIEGGRADQGNFDILWNCPNTVDDKPLSEDITGLMDEAMRVFAWQEVKVLKEPMCQFALESWIKRYKSFANAKYIWNRRDLLEVAKSTVRLKYRKVARKILGYRGHLTVKKALKALRQHEAELERVMPTVNHIVVQHRDLINNHKAEFERMREFLGVELLVTRMFQENRIYRGNDTKKHGSSHREQ